MCDNSRRVVTTLALAALVAVVPGLAVAQSPEVCLFGFSKVVKGEFRGDWSDLSCSALGRDCKTGFSPLGSNEMIWSVENNPAKCAPGETCDETRELQGRLHAKVDLRLREQRPCPYRGHYQASFRLLDVAGLPVASGRLQATVGVGTHQKKCVGPGCDSLCESCYDVSFLGNEWELGSEGFLLGNVTAGPYKGCTIRASYEGDFFPLGGFWGPVPPNVVPWRYLGHIDGVLECPCGL